MQSDVGRWREYASSGIHLLTGCYFHHARRDMGTTSCLLLEGDVGDQAFPHPLYLLQDGVDVQRHKTLIFLLRFAILLLYV